MPNSRKTFYNKPVTSKGSFYAIAKWLMNRESPLWQKQSYRKNTSIHDKIAKGVAVTPIIHACMLIQTPTMNILTDPIWSERASPVPFLGPKRIYEPPVTLSNLPKIDVVLISHNHYDHLDKATIKKLELMFSPTFITGLGNKPLLKKLGVKKVIELDWWQQASNLPIHFVQAQHFSGRGLFDRNSTLWGGFIIKSEHKNIYFAGDTGYGSFFKDIYKKFGAIDLAILPIGAYMPREFMRQIHMNPDDAVTAMLDLQARNAIGMHFDSFAKLADEPQFFAAKDLHQALVARNIPLAKFIAPVPGRTYYL